MERMRSHGSTAAAAGDAASSETLSSNKKRKSKVTEVTDSTKRKYSRRTKNIPRRCPLLTLSNQTSTSLIASEVLENRATIIESDTPDDDDDFSNDSADLNVNACGFPYYRSWCNGRKRDAVLVKDACVSCTIFPPVFESSKCKGSSLERNLLSQIKTEYKDLSSITRKISAYTKEIITSLAARTGRGSSVIERADENSVAERGLVMQPIAMQYFDKSGRPCLKLRLQDSQELSTSQRALDSSRKQSNAPHKEEKTMRGMFSNSFSTADETSSNCSSSSIYNYLMFGRRRMSTTTKDSSEARSTSRISGILSQWRSNVRDVNTCNDEN